MDRLRRLQGMGSREPREEGHLIVHLGIIFHAAASQGVKVGVYREVELAKKGEVPHQLRLRQLGKLQVASQHSSLRKWLGRHV